MSTGVIKTLNTRGFGFIEPSGGGEDIFFHASSLEGVEFEDLAEGDEVEFEVKKDGEGDERG